MEKMISTAEIAKWAAEQRVKSLLEKEAMEQARLIHASQSGFRMLFELGGMSLGESKRAVNEAFYPMLEETIEQKNREYVDLVADGKDFFDPEVNKLGYQIVRLREAASEGQKGKFAFA